MTDIVTLGSRLDRTAPTCSHSIARTLHDLAVSNDFVDVLRRSARVADGAAASRPAALVGELGALASGSALEGLLAIESLASVRTERAGEVLVDLLWHSNPAVRRHATWRLGEHPPHSRALPGLLDQLSGGGIDTMHAHRTLRTWAAADPTPIVGAVTERLLDVVDGAGRARLVDVLGVVPGPHTTDLLIGLATDRSEVTAARCAAIGALGERIAPPVGAALHRLATLDDVIGSHAALALRAAETTTESPTPTADRGLRVAQLVLAAGLDGQLSLGGRGDTGGVASLLVSLGDALARRTDIDHVLTIGLGSVTDALTGPACSSETPLSYGMIAIGDDDRPADQPNQLWEHLPAIERGIRRVLRLAGPIDLLHLRMADVGTLAGSQVARSLGIPICFSLAADPHNVIQSLQSRGELDHDAFITLDQETHVWFRARLVEHLARTADRLALFPRSHSPEVIEDMTGGSHDPDRRAAVIAEGIDIELLRRAADQSRLTATTHQHDILALLGQRIPEDRRALPLLVSVGRLHPVKGMERVVGAWARDRSLHERCNLVVVGGDLEHPSAAERTVLGAIDAALPADDPRRVGLVMLGGRPHADVARLLVAAATGRPGSWAPGGVYVDGALKEEFGLAVLEALAAGLVVTAPSTGGPSTYVDDGVTGVLVDPGADLAAAIRAAFDLVDHPGRAAGALAMVEERYSVDAMAAELTELYRPEVALL